MMTLHNWEYFLRAGIDTKSCARCRIVVYKIGDNLLVWRGLKSEEMTWRLIMGYDPDCDAETILSVMDE